MSTKVYEKYTKTFPANIFKNLDFYLDRNNPKSFVLSVTPRNLIKLFIYSLSNTNCVYIKFVY